MNKHHSSIPTLGIDIGRVIICPADPSGNADTSFLSGSDEQALETPPGAGAFAAIAELNQAFAGRVWLVSKCGPRIQSLTLRWLERQRFHELTGVAPDHVRFVVSDRRSVSIVQPLGPRISSTIGWTCSRTWSVWSRTFTGSATSRPLRARQISRLLPRTGRRRAARSSVVCLVDA